MKLNHKKKKRKNTEEVGKIEEGRKWVGKFENRGKRLKKGGGSFTVQYTRDRTPDMNK